MKLLAFMSVALSICCGQQVSIGGAEQIVPGLLVTDLLEIDGQRIERGHTRNQVMKALGRGAKTFQKPKRCTTEKLLSENELVSSMAPMFPRMIELGNDMARRCGECWVEGIALKFGKKDEIRVMLMGPDKDSVAAQYVIVDHDRALMKRFGSQFMKDGFEGARYYVTEEGTWRVSERNAAVKIERVPGGSQSAPSSRP